VAALGVLLAGCGGDSNLSKSAYRAKLSAISHEADKAQNDVAQALGASSVDELHSRLVKFADASEGLGDEIAKLKAPKDAVDANAELARGEHDTAKEVRSAAAAIQKLKTPRAAITYLQQLGNLKGGRELTEALRKLRRLGYTTGG
jgi:hypothetical protein